MAKTAEQLNAQCSAEDGSLYVSRHKTKHQGTKQDKLKSPPGVGASGGLQWVTRVVQPPNTYHHIIIIIACPQ